MTVKKSPSDDSRLSSYTEDDTFKILRRTLIQDMDSVYRSRYWEFYSDTKTYNDWLELNGWTDSGFIHAGNEYTKKRREEAQNANDEI